MTLLSEALKIKSQHSPNKNITDEHIELAVAWIKGEIGLKSITGVLGIKGQSGNVLYKIATYLREGYRRGIIKL